MRLLLAAALLAFCAVTQGCGEASRPETVVISPQRLAGLAVSPATSFRQLRRFFATPVSAGFDSYGCRLRFRKLGLRAEFISFADGTATPETCDIMSGAVATTPRWRTPRGLRVGATLHALHRVYPRADSFGEVGGTHWGLPAEAISWELAAAPHTGHAAHLVLFAYGKRGRVVALGLQVVGH
jgi:hypothetical protein